LITASHADGDLFNLLSIDAGNLSQAGLPLGYVPGMTLELVGFLSGGGIVTQSLEIIENQFTTFDLIGFTGLTALQMFAPPVLPDGIAGTPDPVVDNLVFSVVPEPSVFGAALFGWVVVLGSRRRNACRPQSSDLL
jgi:hypothetical protein